MVVTAASSSGSASVFGRRIEQLGNGVGQRLIDATHPVDLFGIVCLACSFLPGAKDPVEVDEADVVAGH